MFETDQVMNKASNVLRVMSDDDRMREAARMREKRLHDEATYLAIARAEGRTEGKMDLLIKLVKSGVLSLQIAAAQVSMSESEFEALCTKN